MLNSVLVVCVGNICRSPMGEYLLSSRLFSAGKLGISVRSAGLGALIDKPADSNSRDLMRERYQIDISGHRGRQLTDETLQGVDVVLVMEGWQKSEIEKQYPHMRGRVFLLGHWSNTEIPDPYRKGRQAFEDALDMIDEGVEQWVGKL